MRRKLAAALAGAVVGSALLVVPGSATTSTTTVATPHPSVPTTSPTIEGPIGPETGKPGGSTTTFDLASVGYEQSEFFISGTATSYTSANTLTSDGEWSVTPSDTAPFKTRMLVYRPIDASKFNGTVVVEWLNVSGGLDSGPDWNSAHVELIRKGYAWVGVSAQRVGVEGGSSAIGAAFALKPSNPERYGSLSLPDDNYSYDIFTQAGAAVRNSASTVLGGLAPKRLIAAGESQSAFRLVTYLDAVAPLVKAYDGYFVHSRAPTGAPLVALPAALDPRKATPDDAKKLVPAPSPTLIRTDLDVPVLTLTTETDLFQFGNVLSRQADSKLFRLWEVAGTAHADIYTLGIGNTDVGDGKADVQLFQSMITPSSKPYGLFACGQPVNSGEQTYVVRAALAALNRWVAGTAPPKAPRFVLDPAQPSKRRLDANGNMRSGIQPPAVVAPIAALAGVGQTGSSFCGLFGTTTPFDTAKLASLYANHAAFVKAWNAATDKAVMAGFVLAADAAHIKAAAAQSSIGK